MQDYSSGTKDRFQIREVSSRVRPRKGARDLLSTYRTLDVFPRPQLLYPERLQSIVHKQHSMYVLAGCGLLAMLSLLK